MGRYQGGYDLIEKYANDRTFRNNSDFARFLHEVEPQCSVNSWRCRIQRWVKQGNDFRDTTTTELSVNKNAFIENTKNRKWSQLAPDMAVFDIPKWNRELSKVPIEPPPL